MKLKWGIIGLGRIAQKFTSDLLLADGHEVYAVASRSEEKAAEFADKNNAAKYYGSYEDLLADAAVDIVYIATPHHMHSQLGVASMAAGKHVLCEKPLGVNVAQVESLIAAARKYNVFLLEGMWSQYNPSLQKVFELVAAGEIGQVNYINADFSFFKELEPNHRLFDPKLAGGSLLDVGIYPLFLAYKIMGLPKEIKAVGILSDDGVDLLTSISMQHEDGISTLMSGLQTTSDTIGKVYGTKGNITIDSRWHEAEGFTLSNEQGSTRYEFPTLGNGFVPQILEVGKCIQQGMKESNQWSHNDSLALATMMDNIRSQIGVKYPFEK